MTTAAPRDSALDPPQCSQIDLAARLVDRTFCGTPYVNQPTLDAALGCRLWLKVETLGPLRSFKGRGADWYMQGSSAGGGSELVTASAGNFGQGVAYAGRKHGRAVVVFSAAAANPLKVQAMRRWGARVELGGEDFDAAMAAATTYASETGAELVVDGGDPRIAEGAGVIAHEIVAQHEGNALDAVVVPMGNGALAGGVGTWLRHAWPTTRVVAVGALGARAMALSWREGRPVSTSRVDTIADGIAIRVPVTYALDVMRACVDEVAEVSDADLIAAMRLVRQHLGLVTEPAGVSGVAAVLADPSRYAGLAVGSVLCGANTDPSRERDFLLAG